MKSLFALLGVTFLFIVLLNIAFAFLLIDYTEKSGYTSSGGESLLSRSIYPNSETGRKLLEKKFGRQEADRIYKASLDSPVPYFAPHPSLHYIMQSTKNASFEIGIEGCRYFPNETTQDIRKKLLDRNLILLLGGSTILGHNCPPESTIGYYLEEITGMPVINMGVGAYDQKREIDKLIYHLRQGIRPKHVIFLDGVNDILTVCRSNYRWEDKVIYHGFMAGKEELERYFQEIKRTKEQPKELIGQDFNEDPFLSKMSYKRMSQSFLNWASPADKNKKELCNQLLEMLKNNQKLILGLAHTYEFNFKIVWQPIGFIEKENEFVGREFDKLPGFDFAFSANEMVKNEIVRKNLIFVEGSSWIEELTKTGRGYVDNMHYSPMANKKIALEISKLLNLTNQK
ncbi:MAG: hypothetical protein EBR01_10905 [Proteobacteria bacterium]|nr:hypothetical protein [Pseudomonadota bacterium]